MHIRQLESEGFCLPDISADNVSFSPTDALTLRGVEILRNAYNVRLSRLVLIDLEAGLRNNYISPASVIDSFYRRNIPLEIRYLTRLIRNNFDTRALFSIHVGLSYQAKYASMFKKVHDHVKDGLPRHKYSRIIRTLIPLKHRWRRKVKKNNLLRETFFSPVWRLHCPSWLPPSDTSESKAATNF